MSRGMLDGRALAIAWLAAACSAALALPEPARAEMTPPAVPELEEGAGIVRDARLAVVLGKALFWDPEAGSDGVACASCHFSAGADSRLTNQLSPGLEDRLYTGGDTEFGATYSAAGVSGLGKMPSGSPAGSNYTLVREDFPLHRLADYADRNSALLSTTNDVVSSAGAYASLFERASRGRRDDACGDSSGDVFHAGHLPARQVEPRNTPTTINAGFFYASFWDGRANNLFNGVDVFGLRTIQADPNKRLIVLDERQVPRPGFLQIRNAALASQAVGPVLSALEMSCAGRAFPDVARRLLSTLPLSKQAVSPTDSVLGPYARASGKGLHPRYRYATLIEEAFERKYWGAAGKFRISNGAVLRDGRGYTQMEHNFSMFWGIAIMLYERTLISDQSRFDSWFASCRPSVSNGGPGAVAVPIGNPTVSCFPDPSSPNQSPDPTTHGLTAQEVLGFGLFQNGGTGPRNPGNPACASCHGPVANFNNAGVRSRPLISPIMSEAAFTAEQLTPPPGTPTSPAFNPVERSLNVDLGDGLAALPNDDQRAGAVHDRGFFNIGVTPTTDDPGNGGLDPYGNPLSLARMFLREQAGQSVVDPPTVIFAPAGSPRATVTAPVNRCTSPGIIELGGTPAFRGCAGSPTPSIPSPLYLDPAQEREIVDGSFKTPSLRNVGLTAPYFHSGNYADLRSVVAFYARGGSRRSKVLEAEGLSGDTSGTGLLGKGPHVHDGPDFGTNVDFFMRDVRSTDEQIDALVAFMLTLTDPRVQCDEAPFDHPELTLSIGHTDTDRAPRDGRADDVTVTLPAVGSEGYAPSSGYCIPNRGDLFAPGMQGRVGGPRVPLD